MCSLSLYPFSYLVLSQSEYHFVCLFICLSLFIFSLFLSALFSSLVSLIHNGRRIAHSTNWLRWNAIMHQKPIVMENHRTVIISIKTDCQCQSFSTMGQQNINQLHKLIQYVSSLKNENCGVSITGYFVQISLGDLFENRRSTSSFKFFWWAAVHNANMLMLLKQV